MKPAPEAGADVVARPMPIETRRGRVECALWGDGPAVVALHGAMGGYDQGLLLARTTVGRPRFRFIALSRPGYLGTPLSLGRTPEEQADLCADVLDALDIRQAAVMAISGGGQCALQFALRHPDRCRGLVMISACSAQLEVQVPFRFQLMKVMARIPPLVAAMRSKAAADPERTNRRAISDPVLRARVLSDPEVAPLLMELQLSVLERMAERLPGSENDIAQSRVPFAYPLEQIRLPTLVVHGTADQAVPFVQARALAARIPRADLLVIEGGEHTSIFTHRDEVRKRVTQFLGAHLGR